MLDNAIAQKAGLGIPLIRRELDAWQAERIKEVIGHARKNSRFYKDMPELPENGFPEAFKALPFTTPDDLKADPGAFLCVHPDDVDRITTLTTSGSTGAPKRIFSSAEDLENTVCHFMWGMNEFVKEGDRVLSLYPGKTEHGMNDLLRKGLERLGVPMLIYGIPKDHQKLFETIQRENITFIAGPAPVVHEAALISKEMKAAGSLADRIKGVLVSAAYVSDSCRSDIKDIWHCSMNEHYAMTETGFEGAVSCPVCGNFHVWECGLYYEIIDPVSGKELPDGQTGELVVTTLDRRAMPLIRYRTGDITKMLPQSGCGSKLKTIERVHDRPEKKHLSGQ